MTGIELDSVYVEDCATGLDDVAERLTKAVGALEKVVHGLEGSWGTGPVGSKIGELYQAVHEMALGCYENHGEVIGDFVAALDGTVGLMDDFRQTMESDVDKFHTAVGELYAGPRPPQ